MEVIDLEAQTISLAPASGPTIAAIAASDAGMHQSAWSTAANTAEVPDNAVSTVSIATTGPTIAAVAANDAGMHPSAWSTVANTAEVPDELASTISETSSNNPKRKRWKHAARRVRLSARLSTLASDASLAVSGFGELVALARFAAKGRQTPGPDSLFTADESDTMSTTSRARSIVGNEDSPWSQFEDQMDADAERGNIAKRVAADLAAGTALPITMSKVNVLTGERRPAHRIWAEWVTLLSLAFGLLVYLIPYRQKDHFWGANAPVPTWCAPAFGGAIGVACLGWLVLLWKNINRRLARTVCMSLKIWTTMGMGAVIFFLEVRYPRTSMSPYAGGGATMVLLMLFSLDACQDKSRRFAIYIGITFVLAFGYNLFELLFGNDDDGIILGTIAGKEFSKQDVKANLFTNILLLVAGGLGTLFGDKKQELLMFIHQPQRKADVEAAYEEAKAERRRARAEEERRARSLFSQTSPGVGGRPKPNRRRSLTASTKKVLHALASAIAEALV